MSCPPHVKLRNGPRVVYQVLGNVMLGWADLQLPLNFKYQPLGMAGCIPGAVHKQLLYSTMQNAPQVTEC